LAADRDSNRLYVASTRNPNQIWQLAAVSATIPRLDVACPAPTDRPLIPVTAKFLPGCSYIHDLALINGQLFANSVGQNAVVCLGQDDTPVRVWWPRCIETKDGPVFGQNHIQLNSIAAGATIDQSFFSASSDQITTKRPGDPDYPVDRRGVVFSGATREPIVRGLTRPHSARLHENKLWLANSGYGEFGCIVDSEFCTVSKLPGWTRGLCFVDDIAFVGTSRVLPRFRQYAPGLDIDSSQCGIHAIDIKSGNLLGSITWPAGNQIFSIEWLSARTTAGLPFDLACPKNARSDLFYCYDPA